MMERAKKKDKRKKSIVRIWKNMTPRRKLLAAGIVAVAVVGVGGLVRHHQSNKSVKASTVMSAEAETGDVSTTISSSGTLAGEEVATINLPVGIKIKKVLVSEGDSVKKGTKLASVYPASVAEILLTVRDNIDDIEDSIDDLDDDDLSDSTSDDYLKKITYDQQLEDLSALEDKLEDILDSGYIKADQAGIIGTVNASDDTEIGSQDTSSTSSGSVDTDTSDVADSESSLVSYSTAADTPYRLAAGTVMTYVASAGDVQGSSVSGSGDVSQDGNGDSEEEGTTEEETTIEEEESDQDDTDSSESQDADDTSSDTTTESSDGSDSTESGTGQSDSSTSGNNQTSSSTQSGTGQTQGNQSVGGMGNMGGGSGASGLASSTTSDTAESVGDIEMAVAFTLNSRSKMVVTVSIDEADIEAIEVDQSADITLTSQPDETISGQITEVGNTATESSLSGSVKYPVSITIDKTDSMKEGMSASAVIYIEEAKDALLVPSAAIQEEAGKAYVYTEKDKSDNLSGKTEVTTGLSDGNRVQIKEGLKEGDTVYYTISGQSSENNSDNQEKEFNPGDMGGGQGMPGGNPPSGGSGGGPGGAPGGQ